MRLFLSPRSLACPIAVCLLALPALVLTTPAQAQIFNGGFETPTVPSGGFTQFVGGQTFGGWTVVGNDILLINTNYGEPGNGVTQFNAIEGVQSVDLTGAGNTGLTDGISQSIATTVGQNYTLSFFVGRASGGGLYATPSTADLSINGGSRLSFTNSSSTANFVNWQQFFSTFTATTASTNITFFNGTASGSNNFVGLDNVQIAATSAPEPASLALLFAGGLPALGIVRRLRRRAQ